MNPDRRDRCSCFYLVRDSTQLTTVVVLKPPAPLSTSSGGGVVGDYRSGITHCHHDLDDEVPAGREGAPQAGRSGAPVVGAHRQSGLEGHEPLEAVLVAEHLDGRVPVGCHVAELVE